MMWRKSDGFYLYSSVWIWMPSEFESEAIKELTSEFNQLYSFQSNLICLCPLTFLAPLSRMVSMSSSVSSLYLEANTCVAPCRIICSISSFPSLFCWSIRRPVRAQITAHHCCLTHHKTGHKGYLTVFFISQVLTHFNCWVNDTNDPFLKLQLVVNAPNC